MMKNYDDVKSRMSGFLRGKLEAGRNELGLCTARYERKSCYCVLKAWLGVLAVFGGVLCTDHVRLHSCHPYILERLPTL